MPEAVRSVAKIRNLRPGTIVCHHGRTFEGDIGTALERILLQGT